MTDREMLTMIDVPMLAAAFPVTRKVSAMAASNDVFRRLTNRQWTDRVAVNVEEQTVFIPTRLHFACETPFLPRTAEDWLFARALQTRSNDGFERQRAVRDLLECVDTWSVPFIVALLGEYIVEILDDVYRALNPASERLIAQFIIANAEYWETTKRRVASYWTAYYRRVSSSDCRQAFSRHGYVGFQLVDRLQRAAFGPHGLEV